MDIKESMLIYAVMTITTTVFLWLADLARKYGLQSSISSFKEENVNKHSINISLLSYFVFLALGFVPLFVISGFRVNVGTDFQRYVIMAENPYNYIGIPYFFKQILVFFVNHGMTVQYFFWGTSFLILFCYFFASVKISSNLCMSILLFIIMSDFFASMNIVRQFIATGIILISYTVFESDKKGIAILLNIIAILIHPSVAIFDLFLAAVHYLKHIKITRIYVWGALCMMMLIPLIIPLVKGILSITVFGKFLNNVYSMYHYRWTFLMIFMYLVVFISIFLFNDLSSLNKKSTYFFYANVFVIAILIGSYFISANAYRIIYVITPFMLLYYPDTLKTIKNVYTRVFVNILIISLCSASTIIMITHNNNDVIPYFNILLNNL